MNLIIITLSLVSSITIDGRQLGELIFNLENVITLENIEKMQWFKDILRNMKSGFIHVKDNKICMMNKAMSEILYQNREISKLISERKEEETRNINIDDNESIERKKFYYEKNSKKILDILLNDINKESIDCVRNNSRDIIFNFSSANQIRSSFQNQNFTRTFSSSTTS